VMNILKTFILILTVCFAILTGAPAQAGDAELKLLSSFVGNWRGESILKGSDEADTFRCRLVVTKGTRAKIHYSGRCTFVTTTLSVNGTIAYSDEKRRYEGAMSTNAGFTGLAVGVQRGNKINFNLKERQKDRGGSDVRIGARILLVGDAISVFFEVEFNDSGHILTADVPFSR